MHLELYISISTVRFVATEHFIFAKENLLDPHKPHNCTLLPLWPIMDCSPGCLPDMTRVLWRRQALFGFRIPRLDVIPAQDMHSVFPEWRTEWLHGIGYVYSTSLWPKRLFQCDSGDVQSVSALGQKQTLENDWKSLENDRKSPENDRKSPENDSSGHSFQAWPR